MTAEQVKQFMDRVDSLEKRLIHVEEKQTEMELKYNQALFQLGEELKERIQEVEFKRGDE